MSEGIKQIVYRPGTGRGMARGRQPPAQRGESATRYTGLVPPPGALHAAGGSALKRRSLRKVLATETAERARQIYRT